MASFYKPQCTCLDKKKCKCNATWYFKVNVGKDPKTGKPIPFRKGGFKTKKDAQDACAALVIDTKNGYMHIESSVTFEAFSKEWLELYQLAGKVKPSTIRVRMHEINRIMPYLAKLSLKEIDRQIYQNAIIKLSKQLAENTLSGVHGTARMIFKKAVELDLIKRDPSEFAIVPKRMKTVEQLESEQEVLKYLEKDDLARFLSVAKEHGEDRDYTMFLLLAYSGIRVGELCALKWKDIDLNEGTISINRTLYNPTNNIEAYMLLTPKTKTSKRTIEIAQIVIKQLSAYRLEQKKMIMSQRDVYNDMGFVFARWRSHAGYPEVQKTVQTRMNRLLRIAGLNEKLTPHSLRHTHTSLLAEAGVDLQAIMERLGHKDDETTKNVYLHVTKAVKKDASHKFSSLMENIFNG